MKKLLSILLCLLLALSLLPVGAFADEHELPETMHIEDENEANSLSGLAIVEDEPIIVIDPTEELHDYLVEKMTSKYITSGTKEEAVFMPNRASEFTDSLYIACLQLREGLKEHPSDITLYYMAPYDELDEASERYGASAAIWNYAMNVTADPLEGDYLRRSIPVFLLNTAYVPNDDNTIMYVGIKYTPHYWGSLTYAQEQQMAKAADAVINSLGFTSMTSGYDKIRAIYKWIGDNIIYENANNPSDALIDLDQTAYSAIINRKTVCAGYSHLMYYMMWKCGIPCRIISGQGGVNDITNPKNNHAWTMVWLRGQWYSMDVTWDAGATYADSCRFNYFLRGRDSGFYNEHFTNRDFVAPDPYNLITFNNTALVNASCPTDYGSRRTADNGKCTAHTNANTTFTTPEGEKIYWCSVCGQSHIGPFTTAPTITSIKANRSTANVGDTITWTATATGGSGTLQYCFYVLKDGSIIQKGSYSTGKAYSYIPTEAGTYTARAYVKDAAGTKVNKTGGTVTVNSSVPAELTITSLSANKTTATEGDTITWTAAATGGTGTLKYCFYIYKGNATVWKGTYGTAKTVSYTPTETGVFKAKVFVKDAAGTSKTLLGGAVTVSSNTPLTVSSLKADASMTTVGDPITWTATATGGSGTLKYCFYIYNGSTVVWKGSYGTAKTVTFAPTEPGSYKAKVFVKDTAGATANLVGGAVTVNSSVPAELTITSLSANKTTATEGDTITWTAAATGGTGTLKYCFYIYKGNATVWKGTYGTAKTVSYTPTETGVFKAKVFVKDAAGTSKTLIDGAVTVSSNTPLTVSSLKADVSMTTVGNTITWTAAATGGSGTLKYCFYIYNGSTVVWKGSYGTAKTVTFAPTESGSYKAKVFVKDASGAIASRLSAQVTVNAVNAPGGEPLPIPDGGDPVSLLPGAKAALPDAYVPGKTGLRAA